MPVLPICKTVFGDEPYFNIVARSARCTEVTLKSHVGRSSWRCELHIVICASGHGKCAFAHGLCV